MFANNITTSEISNESISDSLAKVLEAYDNKIVKLNSLWRPPKNITIEKLRSLPCKGGLLESDWDLAKNIREILTSREVQKEEAFVKKHLDYLENRIQYLFQEKKRSPQDLTADYKILLVGDGWVTRSHKNNPVIKGPREFPYSMRQFLKKRRFNSLDLRNRLYYPEQVYTIDCNPAQFPDLCAKFEELEPGILPTEYFDFIYLEGFGYDDEVARKQALKIALAALKEDGLILMYDVPKDPCCYSENRLLAKSGNITQEKLNKVPVSIKRSVQRNQYNLDQIEREPEVSQICLTPSPFDEEQIYLNEVTYENLLSLGKSCCII